VTVIEQLHYTMIIGINDGDVCEREEEDSEEDMNARRELLLVEILEDFVQYVIQFTQRILTISIISGNCSLPARFLMLTI